MCFLKNLLPHQPVPDKTVNFESTSIYFILLSLLIFFPAQITQAHLPQYEEISYERGLEQANEGNVEEALAIWQQTRKELEEPDFRISHSFIKLVTEHKLKDYYVEASQIYNWGLGGTIEVREKKVLLTELGYLRPLIGDRNYRNYKDQIEDGNPDVLSKIKSYWSDIDLTPLSPYNERLMEHWERVIFAKKNYSKNNSDELDDRAYVYLKYGEPYYDKKGQLDYVPSLVTRLLREGIKTPSFSSGEEFAISATQRMNLENRIKQYHYYPQYEVWIYRDLSDNNQNTIFMFGTRSGTSSFRKIQSVDDFIPNEAYRIAAQNNYSFSTNAGQGGGGAGNQDVRFDARRSNESRNPKVNISPALILQLMYYHQLAALDTYFGSSYNQMMDQFVSSSNMDRTNLKGLARQFGTLYGDDMIHIQSYAPDEASGYKAMLMDIPTNYYTYRFLDEEGNPFMRLYSVTSFEEAAYYDILKETNTLQGEMSGRYSMINGYLLKGEVGEELAKEDKNITVISLSEKQNQFEIMIPANAQSVQLSHELHSLNEQEEEQVSTSTVFPNSLKGLNTNTIEVPEPIVANGLTMSDIIMGHSSTTQSLQGEAMSESQDQDIATRFMIDHDRIIPEGTELNLYYELYNLETVGTGNIAEYRFEYSITEDRKGIFSRDPDPLISISLNNNVAGDRHENEIIIDTSNQETGNYKLNITITDMNSGATYSREETFEIR